MSKAFTTIVVILLFVLPSLVHAQIRAPWVQQSCTACGTEGGDYLIYTPSPLDPGKDYSLLINLHGQSEAGSVDQADNVGIPSAISNNSRDIFDAYEDDYIVALPYTSNRDDWNMANVKTFLEYIKSQYNIDENRVYISGVSMGAKGAWDFALNYPDDITAVVSLMGSATPDINPCAVENVAFWSIQGEADGIFPPDAINSTGRKGVKLISDEIINECDPAITPIVTLLPGKTHSGWDEAAEGISGFYVFDWMDQITAVRNVSGVKTGLTIEGRPLVNIGPDRIFVAGDQPYYFNSFILDPNDPDNSQITNPSWSISGGSGTFSTPNQTSTQLSGLTAGNTYTVTFSVQDDQGYTVSDQVTVEVIGSPVSPDITKVELWSNQSGSWENVRDITDFQTIAFDDVGDIFDFRVYDDGASSFRFEYGNNFAFRKTGGATNFFGLNGHNDYVPSEGTFVLGFTGYNSGPFALTNPGTTRQFVVEIVSSALPVTFMGFTGKATLNGVKLKWLTTDEEGNSHFEVYRGRTSESFKKIGEVPRTENPELINEYTFTDTEAEGGIYYYQVKNVDFDGHTDLTDIIRLDVETAFDRYYIYPNPASSNILKVRSPNNLIHTPMEIQVSNASGKEIMNIRNEEQGLVRSVDISSLPSGLYHIRIYQDGQVNHFRVVRQ